MLSFSMKTAISVPDEIFREVEEFAREHNYSRSEIFVLAVKELLEKIKSQKLLDALNKAYLEPESEEEKTARKKGLTHFKTSVLRKERY